MHDLPDLLTIDETASALRVSKNTVRRRVADGTLTPIRVGRQLRIPVREIERALLAGVGAGIESRLS